MALLTLRNEQENHVARVASSATMLKEDHMYACERLKRLRTMLTRALRPLSSSRDDLLPPLDEGQQESERTALGLAPREPHQIVLDWAKRRDPFVVQLFVLAGTGTWGEVRLCFLSCHCVSLFAGSLLSLAQSLHFYSRTHPHTASTRSARSIQVDGRTIAPVLATEETAAIDIMRRRALCYRGSRGNANLFTVVIDGVPKDEPLICEAMTLYGISVRDFDYKVGASCLVPASLCDAVDSFSTPHPRSSHPSLPPSSYDTSPPYLFIHRWAPHRRKAKQTGAVPQLRWSLLNLSSSTCSRILKFLGSGDAFGWRRLHSRNDERTLLVMRA